MNNIGEDIGQSCYVIANGGAQRPVLLTMIIASHCDAAPRLS